MSLCVSPTINHILHELQPCSGEDQYKHITVVQSGSDKRNFTFFSFFLNRWKPVTLEVFLEIPSHMIEDPLGDAADVAVRLRSNF